MRAFIAIPVSGELRDQLCLAIDQIRSRCSAAPVKWVSPEQFHLTLRFLGETPDEQVTEITKRLRGVAGSFAPIKATVSGLGCFPSGMLPKVIWIGINADSRLRALQDAVLKATEEFGETPLAGESFHPHLTLGRVRDTSTPRRRRLGENLQQLRFDSLGVWWMDRVALMKSELSSAGSRYTTLAEIPLAATENPAAELSGEATSARAP